ncbi:MAG: fluoride efflux transporter CrcB [Pyrinomonadaceae bacterium]|nr:fluoride efflux transporter CrcB [Pyrinomonadaceae bacterium]
MESFAKICFIALGGAFGAVARHLVNISPLHNVFDKFVLPTFLINVVGSFVAGFSFILLTSRFSVSENVRLAIMVGFIGSFTTFATFELEIWGLIRNNHYFSALTYLFLSVAVGFIGLIAGIWLARNLPA